MCIHLRDLWALKKFWISLEMEVLVEAIMEQRGISFKTWTRGCLKVLRTNLPEPGGI